MTPMCGRRGRTGLNGRDMHIMLPNVAARNLILVVLTTSLSLVFASGSPFAFGSSKFGPKHRETPFIVYSSGIGEPTVTNIVMSGRPSYSTYLQQRQAFLDDERSRAFGADYVLGDREKLANEVIMLAKNEELEAGFKNPYNFAPSQHIFNVLDKIKASQLFKLLQRMPKGAVLHAHDTSLCSTDYVLSLTYRNHLWQCRDQSSGKLSFLFSRSVPQQREGSCKWALVAEERSRIGAKKYDVALRKLLTLYTKEPEIEFKDINEVWRRFIDIFVLVEPILTYLPVWKDYYYRALKEFYADGVQYLELRGTLPILYDLDGNVYTQADTLAVYYETLNEFKELNPSFIGSKFIYGPNRRVNDTTFKHYMETIVELQEQFPSFLAGFDLVSQEDTGRPLIDFASYLLSLPDSVNFFFHAGETNWYGESTDENLVDAVLLGTKRIGHGYAIIKHPKVLELVKEKNIPIEVNPISNQVLKLNSDNRNHPCSVLFANNYPVVISSDDPSFWEASPLTHDFYIAFLGIASKQSDLRTLKKLAINSIVYSSMNSAEKEIAFRKWEDKWNDYIEWVISTKK